MSVSTACKDTLTLDHPNRVHSVLNSNMVHFLGPGVVGGRFIQHIHSSVASEVGNMDMTYNIIPQSVPLDNH